MTCKKIIQFDDLIKQVKQDQENSTRSSADIEVILSSFHENNKQFSGMGNSSFVASKNEFKYHAHMENNISRVELDAKLSIQSAKLETVEARIDSKIGELLSDNKVQFADLRGDIKSMSGELKGLNSLMTIGLTVIGLLVSIVGIVAIFK